MDWFFDFLDRIIQNRIWAVLFGHFGWVDWATVIFILAGLIYGLKRGFFRAWVVTLETCVVLWIVFTFEKKFAGLLNANLSFLKEGQARPTAYLALMFLSALAIMVLDDRLKNLFHTKLAGPVKYTGGVIFGVVFFILIWSMLSRLLILTPVQRLHKPYVEGGSKTGPAVAAIAPKVYHFMAAPFSSKDKKK